MGGGGVYLEIPLSHMYTTLLRAHVRIDVYNDFKIFFFMHEKSHIKRPTRIIKKKKTYFFRHYVFSRDNRVGTRV